MTMDPFERFIVNNAVASKLSETPIVDQMDGVTIVFVHGFPMTLRGFYTLTSKAILGAAHRMSMKVWKDLHVESRVLCQPLKIELHEDREAYTVVQGIRKALDWSKDTFDRKKILKWIENVEENLHKEKE